MKVIGTWPEFKFEWPMQDHELYVMYLKAYSPDWEQGQSPIFESAVGDYSNSWLRSPLTVNVTETAGHYGFVHRCEFIFYALPNTRRYLAGVVHQEDWEILRQQEVSFENPDYDRSVYITHEMREKIDEAEHNLNFAQEELKYADQQLAEMERYAMERVAEAEKYVEETKSQWEKEKVWYQTRLDEMKRMVSDALAKVEDAKRIV